MNGSVARYWLLMAVLLAAIYGSFVGWRILHSEAQSPRGPRATTAAEPKRQPLTDFVLTDSAGEEFDSASLRGKVWVGSFFFTNCPAMCWRLNQALAGLQETSPASAARYVSITCDPDNDTPQALAAYAQRFKADPARWTFLTGDLKLIRRIGNDFFQVAVDKGTHSDRAFVVDRKGQVRGRFRLTEPDQVEMLRRLLAVVEAEPADEAPPSTNSDQPAQIQPQEQSS
ncbi:MAG TPA: SCO family protein [Pirellulales bacterium]|jgi:protein SCO1/2|nr:SCO family protein [Pirellulales bacterium]